MQDDPLYRDLPDSFDERVSIPEVPPETRPEKKPSWMPTIVILVYVGLSGVLFLSIVPKFKDVYEQMKVPMPTLTQWLMDVSSLFCAAPWLWGLFGFGMGALAVNPKVRESRWTDIILSLLLVIGGGFIVVAMFSPLIVTLQGIGTG